MGAGRQGGRPQGCGGAGDQDDGLNEAPPVGFADWLHREAAYELTLHFSEQALRAVGVAALWAYPDLTGPYVCGGDDGAPRAVPSASLLRAGGCKTAYGIATGLAAAPLGFASWYELRPNVPAKALVVSISLRALAAGAPGWDWHAEDYAVDLWDAVDSWLFGLARHVDASLDIDSAMVAESYLRLWSTDEPPLRAEPEWPELHVPRRRGFGLLNRGVGGRLDLARPPRTS